MIHNDMSQCFLYRVCYKFRYTFIGMHRYCGKFLLKVRVLFHAHILLIMMLFDMLIPKMIFISGANKYHFNLTLPNLTLPNLRLWLRTSSVH